jgi:hypothetical protein
MRSLVVFIASIPYILSVASITRTHKPYSSPSLLRSTAAFCRSDEVRSPLLLCFFHRLYNVRNTAWASNCLCNVHVKFEVHACRRSVLLEFDNRKKAKLVKVDRLRALRTRCCIRSLYAAAWGYGKLHRSAPVICWQQVWALRPPILEPLNPA